MFLSKIMTMSIPTCVLKYVCDGLFDIPLKHTIQ